METIEFETAKKLKELSVTKESYFWYDKNGELVNERIVYGGWDTTPDNVGVQYITRKPPTTEDEAEQLARYTAAYTLDEILGMLPPAVETFYDLEFHKSIDRTYWFGYRISINDALHLTENYENPAEAAGQLLIWCIENGYVKVEELNNE